MIVLTVVGKVDNKLFGGVRLVLDIYDRAYAGFWGWGIGCNYLPTLDKINIGSRIDLNHMNLIN